MPFLAIVQLANLAITQLANLAIVQLASVVIFVRTFLLYTYIIHLENVNISKQYEKLKELQGLQLGQDKGQRAAAKTE